MAIDIKKIKQDILNMALLCRDKMDQMEHLKNNINTLKEEIRGQMKEYDIKELDDDLITVKVQYQIPDVDPGQLLMDEPEVAELIVKTKTTNFIEAKDRRWLKENYRKIFDEYRDPKDPTPRLYIKRR